MSIRRYELCAIFLGLVTFLSPAHADVRCEGSEPPVVTGTIKSGDFESLLKCLSGFINGTLEDVKNPIEQSGHTIKRIGWIYLNSSGGNVNEAIKIGRFFRESLAEVVVSEKCLSSCFLAAVGAVKLYAGEPFGNLGIHRIYYSPSVLNDVDSHEYEIQYNEIKKGMNNYLRDLDVPHRFAELLFSVPSDQIYFLTEADLRQIRIRPAYDEWIAAQCNLRDAQTDVDTKTWSCPVSVDG